MATIATIDYHNVVVLQWLLPATVVQRALQPVQTVLGLEMIVVSFSACRAVCGGLGTSSVCGVPYRTISRQGGYIPIYDDIDCLQCTLRRNKVYQRPYWVILCDIYGSRRLYQAIYGLYSALEGAILGYIVLQRAQNSVLYRPSRGLLQRECKMAQSRVSIYTLNRPSKNIIKKWPRINGAIVRIIGSR